MVAEKVFEIESLEFRRKTISGQSAAGKEKERSDWLCAVCAFILITLHRYNIAQLIYQLIS